MNIPSHLRHVGGTSTALKVLKKSGFSAVCTLVLTLSAVQAAAPKVFNGSGTIFARPNGISFTWTYGSATTPEPGFPGTYPITQISYHNVGAPINWTLTRGHFEFSTNSGGSWSPYTTAPAGSTNFTSVSGKIWRFVDTSASMTTESVGFAYFLSGGPTSNVGTGSTVIPDAAPTDITSSTDKLFSTAVANDFVAQLTPTDTGDTSGGHWAIDSQSVPNLFSLSFNNTTGNKASLLLSTGTIPAIGQTVTVTVRYYDTFQTDTSGVPISGQGFSKQLTFTVAAGASNALTLGNDVVVNTYTTSIQSAPAVATLSTGNLAVVWQSAGQGGKNSTALNGIYGQLLTSTGTKTGSEFVVSNASATVDETAPAVTALNTGRFAVAYATGTGATDIGFRIVEANGTVGAQLTANSTTAGSQYSPSMATLTDGSFVIVWYSDNGDVRLRQFNAADGTPVAGEVLIADGLTAGGYYPSVTGLSNGGYAVAWVDNNSSEIKTKVNGGGVVSTGIVISGYGGPRVAGLTGGGYVLASESNDSGTGLSKIEAVRYNNSGTIQGSKFTVNTLTGGNRYQASATALSGGGFLVAWSSEQDDFQNNGIMGRRFTAAGAAVDAADFQVNQIRANDQSYPALAPIAGDLFGAVWTDTTAVSILDGTYLSDIEARVLLPVATGPSITNVTSSTADGAYHATQTIDISVVFSAPVDVTGAPQITLETGTIDRTIAYQVGGGSGTNTLHFTYTVQSGDSSPDLDYASSSALALAGGTINATTGGTPAVLTLPAPGASGSLGANKNIIIDTTPPTVQSVTRLSPSGQNTNATTVTFRVTYSEPVNLTAPLTTHFQVMPVNGSTITGTVQSVTGSDGTATRDVTVQITGGTGEFRLRVID